MPWIKEQDLQSLKEEKKCLEKALGAAQKKIRDQEELIEKVGNEKKKNEAESEYLVKIWDAMGSFGKSLIGTQSTLGSLSMKLASEHDRASKSKETAAKNRRVAEEIASEWGSFGALAEKSKKQVEELGQQTKAITGVVDLIRQIASQTNLLALNAAIESARAGEAGRGFAVVADEVRKLAEKTNDATGEIERLVKNIERETKESQEGMANLVAISMESGKRGVSGAESLKSLVEDGMHMESGVATSAIRSFCEVAKLDHIVFKFKVYAGVAAGNPSGMDHCHDYKICRLGKWYYEGQGRKCFTGLAGFGSMESPHKGVHENARKAMDARKNNDWDGVLKALTAMEEASQVVMDRLNEMANDGESNPAKLFNLSC